MGRYSVLRFWAFVLIGFAAACSNGESGPLVEDAWLRLPPPGAPTAAIYFTLANRGAGADRLTGVATPIAEHASLHRSVEEGGMTGMRPVDSLEIPARGQVRLEPGGYHIMLERLSGELAEGDSVSLTLHFARAGTVDVEVPVRRSPPSG